MTDAEALAGALVLRPGRAIPNIETTRTTLAARLVAGRPAQQVPERLASVFTLCGGAHRLVAGQAIAAAQGKAAHEAGADRDLQADTLREHLRRLWLDWPVALTGTAVAAGELAALRDCPLLRRAVPVDLALGAMRAWLAVHVLDMPAIDWLERWQADPAPWLDAWSRRANTLPARLLADCRELARALAGPPRALRVMEDAPALTALAETMRAAPGFVRAPQWQGACAETGPWTRLHDAQAGQFDNAWLRLGARLADAVRLALPDVEGRSGARWLARGALALGEGEGLAWCEMARGLLVHRVRLHDDGRGEPCVAEYDVLAPTEWNFHPHGAVAQALAMDLDERAARVLAAAFDPCVSVRVERSSAAAPPQEQRDA